MRIWKYPLALTDTQDLFLPNGAKPLDAQVQNGQLRLWVLVNELVPVSRRRFAIYGTGAPMPDEPGEYVATFQIEGGALVFHVFDRSGHRNEDNEGCSACN